MSLGAPTSSHTALDEADAVNGTLLPPDSARALPRPFLQLVGKHIVADAVMVVGLGA